MWVKKLRYLQHVVDDVEFDDGLSSDQVVHHGVIQVMCHGEGQQQDQGLQDVAHVRWLQQPRPTEHTQNTQFIKAKWPVQKRERNTLKVAIIGVYVLFIHVEFQQNIFKKFLV